MDEELAPLIHRFGAVNTQFLARPVESLDPAIPITVNQSVTIREAIECLQRNKIGCLLVVDDDEKLSGVFSERDVLMRVIFKEVDVDSQPLVSVMTKNPKSEQMSTTVAFILQQMSDGGFRHLPIVDEENFPIGIVSAKDFLDFIKFEIISQAVSGELGGR